jgi:hypothetical protein
LSAPGDGLSAPAEPPRPAVTALTEPYWRAAQDGRFVLQHCRACGTFTHFPADACAGCGLASQLDWREVSGAGWVYTFSIVHRSMVPGLQPPYVIAWIDLSEGPRVFGGVQGCAPDDVFIDMPVHVVFEERAGFGRIPTFAPCDAPTEARL